ncbi:MAG TPA: catecholate siderophore receptor Fiu [Burkholderiaceae bacterium]|nr:catecholate siderophore receptor Fiu [Burkholderiaceae bacterium]
MSYIKRRKHHSVNGLASGASLGAALLAGVAPWPISAQDTSSQTPSTAQEAPDANTAITTLPTVTVTGEEQGYLREQLNSPKFVTPVSQTPKTLQIISRELMEDQKTTNLTEALRNTPGVGAFSMGETGSSSTGDAVYMRGVDASGSIFVDGVRDAGSINRDTFNIEQVEVVKGADGSLFGRTALNGTINMATKKAHLGNRGELDLQLGTHNQRRATADFNQQIGERTAIRLNLVGENSHVPGRDKVRNKHWGIAPAISFGLGTDTRLHLDFLHIDQRNQPDGGLPTLGLPGYHADPDHPEFARAPRPDSTNYYGTYSDYDNVRKDQFTATFEKDINDRVTFHNITRWARTHQQYVLSSFSSDWDPTWDMHDFSNWQASRAVNTKDQVNRIFANQAGFVHELETGPVSHTLSYGLEFSQERVRSHNMDVVPDASQFPLNIYHPSHAGGYRAEGNGTGATGRTTTIAGYLFDTLEVGDRWQLNGGLRLDHYRARFDSTESNPRLEGIHSKKNKNLLSWQLGTLYKLNAYGNIYAQYAVAQQPPGNDGLMLSGKAKYPDRPEYDPQRSRTLELGTKWKVLDDNLLLSAAVFRTDIDNQVEVDEVSGDFVQSGEKRIQGLELSATGQITPNWDVMLGYTRLSAKVRKGAEVAKDGSKSLIYTPRDAFSGWTSYRFANGLTVGGGARYVGTMQRDAKGTPATPERIDSYWVVDAMARYAVSDNVDVQLNGYNLTNKKYVAAINKKGHRYIPGVGRSAMLSLRIKY